MVEISKEKFYEIIREGKLDICVNANSIHFDDGSEMHTDFKFRSGLLFGREITNFRRSAKHHGERHFYIEEYYLKPKKHDSKSEE